MDAWYSEDEAGEKQNGYPLKKMIFDMPEEPVTVGIDWTPDYLKTYVDGQEIRHLENRYVSRHRLGRRQKCLPAYLHRATAEEAR